MSPPADGKNQDTIQDLNLAAAGYDGDSPKCAISPNALRINFETQQTMAINLVRCLFERAIISDRIHVVVIGGGLSGVTTAAYLLERGCRVTILEVKHEYFHKQRKSSHRFIHPTINFWPKEDLRYTTNLPLLNWHADSCDRVIEQISCEWDRIIEKKGHRLKSMFGVKYVGIDNVKPGRDGGKTTFEIKTNDSTGTNPDTLVGDPIDFNFLIDCTGFAEEASIPGKKTPGYWEFRNPEDKPLAIYGSGDGGLIEAIMHVFDIRMEQMVEIAEEINEHNLRESLQLAEDKNTLRRFLSDNKDTIMGMKSFPKAVRRAKLITRSKDIHAQNTAPIHRIMIQLAKDDGKIKFHQDCVLVRIEGSDSAFKIRNRTTNAEQDLDNSYEIIARIGPERKEDNSNTASQKADPTMLREFARRFELDDLEQRIRDPKLLFEKAIEAIYRWLDHRRLKKPSSMEIIDCNDCFEIIATPCIEKPPGELFGKKIKSSSGYIKLDIAHGP